MSALIAEIEIAALVPARLSKCVASPVSSSIGAALAPFKRSITTPVVLTGPRIA